MTWSIGARVNLIGGAALVGMLLMLCLSIFQVDKVMRNDIANQTQKTVEIAYSVIAHYHAEEAAGRLSRSQAQAAALAAISPMRYADTNYLWINDMQPRMLMHPTKPEMVGKDVANVTDPNGVHLYLKMVEVVRAKGAGVVHYSWTKPGYPEPQPKISFVKGFAPWGWIVGSGVYDNDIQAAVFDHAVREGLMALAVIVAVSALAYFLGLSITRPLKAITARMRTLAQGDKDNGIPGIGRRDETGEMASALAVFRDVAVAKDQADAAKAEADAEQQFVVDTVSARLATLSEGDLTAEIDVAFPASYGALKRNYNTAVGNLRDLIGALSQSATTLRTGASEIAQASEDLARRTESNAASLEETSASLTQMRGRLRNSAEASTRTVGQTNAAIRIVGDGRTTADDAVAAMNRVSASAQGIDSVIEGLDKIAFQTRVLAMNAAVEAGRAGEAGRGFAVVADLVSALAMRAEEEAGRARDQLTSTQTDIGTAVGAVQNVDGALANIAGSVEQVHLLVASMAEDNRAQSDTIGEIASAVDTMDSSTQQNAAMVEQTSAAARNLSSEVDRLAEHAASFRSGSTVVAASAKRTREDRWIGQPRGPRSAVVAPTLVAADEWASV